ncbi:MAG TPA: hypothetical protein VN516_00555, partial [Candidatus Baltobacteraceae bacterium]|nr:hypothetical protein [Candidatus Baltobacteraceae bacterium]
AMMEFESPIRPFVSIGGTRKSSNAGDARPEFVLEWLLKKFPDGIAPARSAFATGFSHRLPFGPKHALSRLQAGAPEISF